MSSSAEILAIDPFALPTEQVGLGRHLQWTRGMFSLAFIRWNHPGQEDAVLPEIQAACDLPIRTLSVAEVPVEDFLAACSAAARGSGNPLFVFGMHRHFPDFLHMRDEVIPPILTVLNLQRELFHRQIGCPLVLWLPEQALQMIARHAPDFWSWRSGVFDFDLPRELWLKAHAELRLSNGLELNVAADEVPLRIAERLGLWQDLTASGRILPREWKTAADVASGLFDLYTRVGDVALADEWFTLAVEQLHQIQEDPDSTPLAFAAAAHAAGLLWERNSRSDRRDRLQKAVACFQATLKVYTEDQFPEAWAITQNNLGNVYGDLPTGDRGENLDRAIACLQSTLRVYTKDRFPHDWAMTQNNLGIVYTNLPTGKREENLTRAIECFQAALQVYTEDRLPHDWARTQNNLGVVYTNLPMGDRGENLRRAIACQQAALRVFTKDRFPHEWARTQHNLGIEYADLLTGDRGENLSQAITCFQVALQIRTEDRFPHDWAMTQNNLGIVYTSLPTGNRGENLSRAIECFHAALRVYTEDRLPSDWAKAQNNLGVAYWFLPVGHRGENLRRAIACYEAALRVYTEDRFPLDWAESRFNSGLALRALAVLTHDKSYLAAALAASEDAVRGFRTVGLTSQIERAEREAEKVRAQLA